MNKICKWLTSKVSTVGYAIISDLFSIVPEDFFNLVTVNNN